MSDNNNSYTLGMLTYGMAIGAVLGILLSTPEKKRPLRSKSKHRKRKHKNTALKMFPKTGEQRRG